MNCAEFQKSLPEIVDGAGNTEQQAHGKTCAVCSDLVQDLKYIAEQAKLLVPMHDPNPRVWAGIQTSLQREGLVRPSAGRFQPAMIPPPSGWGTYLRYGAAAAILLIAFALIMSSRSTTPVADIAANSAASNEKATDANDQSLIAVVVQQKPERAEVYKRGLHDVNSYIADAKKNLDENPSDDEARAQLMQAYDQKAMLYDMATAGTTE